MTKTIFLMLISSVIFLSACATLSPQECHTANWKQIGEKDGQSGLSSRIANHYKACSKVNVVPNQNLYEEGYKQGQKQYCQPRNIYKLALNGSGSYRVCPVEQHSELRPFYDVPHQFYQAEVNKNNLDRELNRHQDYLLDKDLSKEKRDQYIKKIQQLKIDKKRIENEYDDAEWKLTQFKRRHYL